MRGTKKVNIAFFACCVWQVCGRKNVKTFFPPLFLRAVSGWLLVVARSSGCCVRAQLGVFLPVSSAWSVRISSRIDLSPYGVVAPSLPWGFALHVTINSDPPRAPTASKLEASLYVRTVRSRARVSMSVCRCVGCHLRFVVILLFLSFMFFLVVSTRTRT